MGLYKVIFLGLTVAGQEEEMRLIEGLQKKFNLSREKAESLIQRVPIVVKKGITKEEMERYVRAFKEIGGRVRVEEEEAEEGLDVAEKPEPVPIQRAEFREFTGTTITCPQCGFKQPETDECIKCGIIISKYIRYQEMAQTFEGKVREITSEEASPWESGEGFFGAFLKTTKDCLFSPTQFFRKIKAGEGYWAPLIYGLITGIIGFGVSMIWQWLLVSKLIPIRMLSFIPYSFYITFIIIGMPFMVALSILIGSMITHICLIIVGGNKSGFQATFRALSYSYCAHLFDIIPFIGGIIGSIYMLILTIIGVREVHEITTGRAVLGVLLPVIVIIVITVLAVIIIPFMFGSIGFFGGARI